MQHDPKQILSVLDTCCSSYTFPMLDNGYVYLAASRLSAYLAESDWALVIEIFGYSPRSGTPDIHVYTFASRLFNRDSRENYVSDIAYARYLENNPRNESRFFYPVDGDYQDMDNDELVSTTATELLLRNSTFRLPRIDHYADYGIELTEPPRVRVFELCRFLAASHRNSILTTEEERRTSILPDMQQILQLEEWNHPDVAANVLPSSSETFQQLAQMLSTDDISCYKPSRPPNTHWQNWPESGTL